MTEEELNALISAEQARIKAGGRAQAQRDPNVDPDVSTFMPSPPSVGETPAGGGFLDLAGRVAQQAGNAMRFSHPAAGLAKSTMGFFTPEEGDQTSNAESVGLGMLDTVTSGNAGAFMAGGGAQPGFNPMMGLVGGIANIAGKAAGNQFVDSDAQDERVDTAFEENPWAAMTGQLAGALALGAGTSAAAIGGLGKLASAGSFGSRIAAMFAGNWAGRAALNAGIGALEGGAYSKSKGGSFAPGALMGALGGALGSLGGDAVGRLLTNWDGSDVVTQAGSILGRAARARNKREFGPEQGEFPMSQIEQNIGTLGDRATLMDADQGVLDTVVGGLKNSDTIDRLAPVEHAMRTRMGDQPGSVMDDFERAVNEMLPTGFQRPAGFVDEARSAEMIRLNAKAYFNSLQGDIENVISSARTTFNPNRVQRAILSPTRGRDGAPDRGQLRAAEMLEGMIREQTPKPKMVSKKGGKRGEKTPVPQPFNARRLQNIRKAIDDAIDSHYKPNGTALQASTLATLVQSRNQVTSMLDQIPGFAEVNAKYATEHSYIRASDIGRRLMRGGDDRMAPDAQAEFMASMSPGDMQGFWEGVSREIISTMRSAGGEGRLARQITRNDTVADKLRIAFPDQADELIDAANQALALTGTSNAVIAGARTSRDLALAGQSSADRARLLDQLTAALSLSNITTGFGTSQAAGLGAGRRLMSGQVDPKIVDEVGRMALSTGDTALRNAGIMEQASADRFRLPRTIAGVDAAMAVERGDVTPSLMTMARTADIGETFPLAAASLTSSREPNTANPRARRRAQRRARAAARARERARQQGN